MRLFYRFSCIIRFGMLLQTIATIRGVGDSPYRRYEESTAPRNNDCDNVLKFPICLHVLTNYHPKMIKTVHPQNVRFQNVRFQNVWFQNIRFQNVRFTKRQVYKTSGFKTSGFKTSNFKFDILIKQKV
jgi:hypothetical protein